MALLDIPRRQRVQSVHTATAENTAAQSEGMSKDKSSQRSKDKPTKGSDNDIIIVGATEPDVIDISESSQSSDAGSLPDPQIINVEAQADFVDITIESAEVMGAKSTHKRTNPGQPAANLQLTNPVLVTDVHLQQSTVTAQKNLVAQSRVSTSKNQDQGAAPPPLPVAIQHHPLAPDPPAAVPPPRDTVTAALHAVYKSPEEKLNDMVNEVVGSNIKLNHEI
jgi:hypothetical protein